MQDFRGEIRTFRNINEFCSPIFSDRSWNDWTFIAHNAKAFDGQFILKWLVDKGIEPEVIMNCSIMLMEIPAFNVRFIDSINFVPFPLALFPKTFPNVRWFSAETTKEGNLKSFLAWHQEKEEGDFVFDFQKELLDYCKSNVNILRRSKMKFREDFIERENIDPLRYSTIASVCTAIFRDNYMEGKTLALNEKVRNENHSKESIEWLTWIKTSKGKKIQHGLNGGEKLLKNAGRVDGWNEETETAFEFHGCFWHGCSKCFSPDMINPVNQKSMGTLQRETFEKSKKIRESGSVN